MRIFYAVMRSPNLVHLPGSNLWYNNLYPSLIETGHEVVPLEADCSDLLIYCQDSSWVEAYRPAFVEELLAEVERAHREKPLNLFFSYFYSACATPEAIKEIRSWGIMTINFYCNNVHQFRLVEDIAPAYDYCMVPEGVTLEKYRAVGARPIHIQMAANPQVYKPYDLPREFDVTFVGQKYANRPHIIDYLLRQGIQVRVWGPGWARGSEGGGGPSIGGGGENLWRKVRRSGLRLPLKVFHRIASYPMRIASYPMHRRLARISGLPLDDEELVKMYSRSKISLGFSVVNELVGGGEPNTHLRLRDFEAPMSGAFYVTGYTDELADYFEPDKEVVCYRSKEELASKVKYYLSRPGEMDRIRRAGYERARRNHTWVHRFEQLFWAVGLPIRGDVEGRV